MLDYFVAIYHKFFKPTPVQDMIAEKLREGAAVVCVRYRNKNCERYYSGSGQRVGSGFGKRRRFNISVESFKNGPRGYNPIYEYSSTQYITADQKELELVLADNFDNVSLVQIQKFGDHDAPVMIKALTSIASRLRAGQGYPVSKHCFITNDFVNKDGYIFRSGNATFIVPARLITMEKFTDMVDIENPFNPVDVIVADQKKIKRQHRSVKDIRRWYEVKQVPSKGDNWVFEFTANKTAEAPVFYYTLDLKIDQTGMEAHPFYIRQIVEDAVNSIKEKHPNWSLRIRNEHINVTWNNNTRTVNQHIELQRNERFNDSNPILIHDRNYATTGYQIPEFKPFLLRMVPDNG